jgi:Terminase RNaseH-like domain
MPAKDVKGDNFVRPRAKLQEEYWPDFVEKMDVELNGKRYKSEVLTLTELWSIYSGTVKEKLSEEDIARGKKPVARKDQLTPIMVRRMLSTKLEDDTYRHAARYHDDGYLHFDQWLRARDQARKDLYWFGKEVMKADFVPEVHQVVCNQFVQKDFDGVYGDNYSLDKFKTAMAAQTRIPRVWVDTAEYPFKSTWSGGQYAERTLEDFGKYMQDPIEAQNPNNLSRTMILMDPRGFFKSTIDGLDCVQWIINCPDIRILIMAGVYKLAMQFLAGVKRAFYLPRGGRGTTFHLLFPEYVVRGVDGDSKEPLVIPTRIHIDLLDPTIGVISVGSSLSGFHCDVIKFDDVVTDENCNTLETREALHEKADGSQNLLMPWGWTDIIGTRYFPDDYYGLKLAKHEDDPSEFPLKFFKRSSWVVKPDFDHLHIRDLTENMVDLVFPQQAGWKYLRKKLRENEKLFRCQQLNEPVWDDDGFKIHFPESLMASRIMMSGIAKSKIGDTIMTCDTARVANKYSDYSALVVARVFQKEDKSIALVILEIKYDRWTQTELAFSISEMANKWNPRVIVVEDTGGLELLFMEAQNQAKNRYGKYLNIARKPVDNNKDAKRNRIKSLELLLKAEQMYFSDDSREWWDETLKQFMNFTGSRSGAKKKDDIPDACSFLPAFLPHMQAKLTQKELDDKAAMDQQQYAKWVMWEQHKALFGTNVLARERPVMIEVPPEEGPLSGYVKKLFGGNGLRA